MLRQPCNDLQAPSTKGWLAVWGRSRVAVRGMVDRARRAAWAWVCQRVGAPPRAPCCCTPKPLHCTIAPDQALARLPKTHAMATVVRKAAGRAGPPVAPKSERRGQLAGSARPGVAATGSRPPSAPRPRSAPLPGPPLVAASVPGALAGAAAVGEAEKGRSGDLLGRTPFPAS